MTDISVPPHIWGDIASQVALKLGLTTNRSPTLTTTIERGVRYITLDNGSREILFDTRALFLGLLATGRADPYSVRYGNTASWFVTWLEEKFGVTRVTDAVARSEMAAPEAIAGALMEKYKLGLSRSVTALQELAATISRATVGYDEFEARHMFAAMMEQGVITEQVRLHFDVSLTPEDQTSLKLVLVDRIMETAGPGEKRDRWLETLGLPPDAAAAASVKSVAQRQEPRSFDNVTDFRRDSVERDSPDLLDTASDARALARLICLEDVAPLAIAILGGWGSGKSTFMERLDSEVRLIADAKAARTGEREPTDDRIVRFVRRVVQIRFNAWQFVDANLWASLTAEFFDQLRAGGWDRAGGARHAGLVERVNSHVHSLTADVEARRQAAVNGGKDLMRAQKARDSAARAARDAPGATLGQAAIDLLGDAYESQRGNLSALGLAIAGVDTSKSIDAILDVVRSSRSVVGQAGAVLRVIGKSPQRMWTAIVSALMLVVAAFIAYRTASWGGIIAAVAAIGAIGSACSALAPALRVVRGVAARSGEIARSVEAADKSALKLLLQKEIELRETIAEAEALQAAADQAARRLSRYIDPIGAPNPPRLLRYVLEDDPDTKALEAEVGLIGRTRRLFQAVDDIVREERRKPIQERLDGEVPDRIILYIDDLDRCTEEQVYAVLQATHLLLAFELFVVVVGVDVTWVQNALSKAVRDDGEDTLRRQRATQYLDKIFQIAFWLRPLTSAGSQGGSFGRYVRALTGRRPSGNSGSQHLSLAAAGSAPTNSTPSAPDSARASVDPVRLNPSNATADRSLTPAQARAALATIQLEPEEVEFLASPTIARIAATTPRAVKRLINVYRLVRTRLSESVNSDMSVGHPLLDYPLIALMVAVETGQPAEIADALYDGLSQLGPSEMLYQQVFFQEPADGASDAVRNLSTAFTKCAGLKAAVEEVQRLRGGNLVARDALGIAKLARRYSFNRYREPRS